MREGGSGERGKGEREGECEEVREGKDRGREGGVTE